MIVDISRTEFSRRFPDIDINKCIQLGMTSEESVGVYILDDGSFQTTSPVDITDEDLMNFLMKFHDDPVVFKPLMESSAYYRDKQMRSIKMRHIITFIYLSLILGGVFIWVVGLVWLKHHV